MADLAKTPVATPEAWRLDARTKISASWALVMMCFYVDVIGFFEPGRLDLFPTAREAMLMACGAAVPAVMVFLTLVLKPRANRAANIVLAAFYALAVMTTMPDSPLFYVLLGIVEMALAASIVWHAWNWPRQPIEARPAVG